MQPAHESSCTPTLDPQPGSLSAALCMPADPNAAPSQDPFAPAGARVTTRELREAYVSANAAFLGRVAVYAGACDGGAGLEGEAECRGTREARTGVYARDNTVGNIVATATCLRVTGCWFPESDCDYATYEQSARTGNPMCQRDNTAFGAMLVFP